MLEFHAPLRRPLGAGSAVSDPLLREAGPGSPLRRSNNADIPRFSSTPLLGLTRPSQIPPKEKPPGALLDAQKMLGPRAPLRRPSWDWLSRLKFLPERSPGGPLRRSKNCWDSALLLDAPLEPDSAVSNSSLREVPALFDAQKKLGLRAPLRRLFSAWPGRLRSLQERSPRAPFDNQTVLTILNTIPRES